MAGSGKWLNDNMQRGFARGTSGKIKVSHINRQDLKAGQWDALFLSEQSWCMSFENQQNISPQER